MQAKCLTIIITGHQTETLVELTGIPVFPYNFDCDLSSLAENMKIEITFFKKKSFPLNDITLIYFQTYCNKNLFFDKYVNLSI